MWKNSWRQELWSNLDQPWDVLIVGGGITGAGILRLASQAGLKALLLEAGDFSSGTSSRSSKLVHGGFRYLYNRQFGVTRESAREREWLLREARQLVEPLPFILPNYARYHFRDAYFACGVILYDLLAHKWQHRRMPRSEMLSRCPGLNEEGLLSGHLYYDARVDDAMLVLRLLKEAVSSGGAALNYARARKLLRTRDGRVCGALAEDAAEAGGPGVEVQARVVINATGPWTDELRAQIGGPPRLRKLRGSHLVFPREKFPLDQALTLFHPGDRRAMFAIPWEGVSLIGTTDIDHSPSLELDFAEPFTSAGERDYLMTALRFLFPGLGLAEGDILSSFSGLRPVVRSGADSPSKESRAHAIWLEDGLLTITGGKLTTFRIMAAEALQRALALLGGGRRPASRRMFDPLPPAPPSAGLDPADVGYLLGRYGAETGELLACARAGELEHIEGLPNLWAELRWAARAGGAVHLDDLLLRRVRLGLQLPGGGLESLARIRAVVQSELAWDDARWQAEEQRYRRIWQAYYSPVPEKVPC